MNRWVLLKHRVFFRDSVETHYDFLVEDNADCLTWKLFNIPLINKGLVEIVKQPNHRLIWLSRLEYELSGNRGLVKRIDNGTFINSISEENCKDLKITLNGKILNGLFEISGNFCKLTNKN